MVGKLTLVMPFYKNGGMLALQYETWVGWPEDVKERIRIILVDDGSPIPAVGVPRPEGLPEVQIYRVNEDRQWHQHAARNLGAHVAPDGWLLLTDMDHMLTAENAKALLESKLDEQTVYTLHRVEADTGEPTRGVNGEPKPHPNSFVMTREMFWRIGGYDEEFCGIYGTDGLFRSRIRKTAAQKHLGHVSLKRYWRDLIPDASTSAPRKEGRTAGAKEKVIAAKIARGELDSVKVLQFEWCRVA